jgi:hypothetical protein
LEEELSMKHDFNDIKKEILKKNLMIKAIYSGGNSQMSKNTKKRLELELDGLLYRYFKNRNNYSVKNEVYRFFDE